MQKSCSEQLLACAQELVKELGRSPTRREFRQRHGHVPEGTIARLYGSWGDLIRAAGAEPNLAANIQHMWSLSEIADAWMRWYAVHGHYPTQRESNGGTVMRSMPRIPSYGTLRKRFQPLDWNRIRERIIGLLGG
jgi:hypothetical protein